MGDTTLSSVQVGGTEEVIRTLDAPAAPEVRPVHDTPIAFAPEAVPQLLALLERAHEATVHQLRNTRNRMHGWMQLGESAEREQAVEEARAEDQVLLDRLDWIGSHLACRAQGGALFQTLCTQESAQVLLAAAFGWGSPEECANRLPVAVDPRAGLALAIWLQMQAPEASASRRPLARCLESDDGWAFQVEESARALPVWWVRSFRGLLCEEPSRKTLVFHDAAFRAAPSSIR